MSHGEDLRGLGRLAVEATTGIVDLVEEMQQAIGGGPRVLGRPLAELTRLFSRPMYGAIRGVTRAVGVGIDASLARLGPLLGDGTPGPEREALLAILNGVLGDHLEASGNPLAIEMRLRYQHRPLALEPDALRAAIPGAGSKVLVLVHGSCLGDRAWTRHDHGSALARDLGFTLIHLQYNTGRHVSTNGRAFAALLERAITAWPAPVEELMIVGHSMGGLVARSACHAADAAGHRWRRALTKLVCIASPHHGAALERGGSWIDVLLGISHYSAPLARLGKIRSAGVTDLRYGNVLDEHWEGRDRFAHHRDTRAALELPRGTECYAIAGTKTTSPTARRPADDGLVTVDSALGRHRRPELTLPFPEDHRWIALGTGHVELLGSPAVYDVLRSWLATSAPSR